MSFIRYSLALLNVLGLGEFENNNGISILFQLFFVILQAERVTIQRKQKRNDIMTTTTGKLQTAHPISYYWNVVKDMDSNQKLELVSMLIESVKPIQTRQLADTPSEENFHDMDKEIFTPEEAYELTMKDIKEIYE